MAGMEQSVNQFIADLLPSGTKYTPGNPNLPDNQQPTHDSVPGGTFTSGAALPNIGAQLKPANPFPIHVDAATDDVALDGINLDGTEDNLNPITLPRQKVEANAGNTRDFDKTIALQKELNALGANLDVDGIHGPLTKAAQAQYGSRQPDLSSMIELNSGGDPFTELDNPVSLTPKAKQFNAQTEADITAATAPQESPDRASELLDAIKDKLVRAFQGRDTSQDVSSVTATPPPRPPIVQGPSQRPATPIDAREFDGITIPPPKPSDEGSFDTETGITTMPFDSDNDPAIDLANTIMNASEAQRANLLSQLDPETRDYILQLLDDRDNII